MKDYQIICIAGLPGSGKTTLAKKLKKYRGGIVLDDLKNIIWLKLVILLKFSTIYVTHPNFCLAKDRLSFKLKLAKIAPKYSISWMYFENNLENCWENVKSRKDNRKISFNEIKYFSKHYKPPKPTLPVLKW